MSTSDYNNIESINVTNLFALLRKVWVLNPLCLLLTYHYTSPKYRHCVVASDQSSLIKETSLIYFGSWHQLLTLGNIYVRHLFLIVWIRQNYWLKLYTIHSDPETRSDHFILSWLRKKYIKLLHVPLDMFIIISIFTSLNSNLVFFCFFIIPLLSSGQFFSINSFNH